MCEPVAPRPVLNAPSNPRSVFRELLRLVPEGTLTRARAHPGVVEEAMQVQVKSHDRPRLLLSSGGGQEVAAAHIVGFALTGALLHQLRAPRNVWGHGGGAAAAQAAATVLQEQEQVERERARLAPATAGRVLASGEASTEPEAAGGDTGEASTSATEDERLCRFCFGGADEMPGGLISPCQCKGTQVRAFIHARAPMTDPPLTWFPFSESS